MPVYNGGRYLKEAIDSILEQTYTNFEFIIINDGSTDCSSDIMSQYSDDRINILTNECNKGLVYSLNRGIKEARGAYILRMDADDISLPDRIKKQVDFMERESTVGICGSYIEVFGDGIKKHVIKYPHDPNLNEAYLLFFTCLAHPSVIIRKSLIDRYNLYYDERYVHAEDYAFWVHAIKFTKISNIKEVLLRYRVLATSVTRQADKDIQLRFNIHKSIYECFFSYVGLSLTNEELYLHFIISNNNRFKDQVLNIDPLKIHSHFIKILSYYKDLNNYNYIAYLVNKRGVSISRWCSNYNFLYLAMYSLKLLYYRSKIIF